jgi:hypothetical protein
LAFGVSEMANVLADPPPLNRVARSGLNKVAWRLVAADAGPATTAARAHAATSPAATGASARGGCTSRFRYCICLLLSGTPNGRALEAPGRQRI